MKLVWANWHRSLGELAMEIRGAAGMTAGADLDRWQRLFAPGKFERSSRVRDGMIGVAEQVGCSLPQLALAWNLAQEGVDATRAGTRNPDHVRTNAEAADIVLTTDQLALLEDLIPLGPNAG